MSLSPLENTLIQFFEKLTPETLAIRALVSEGLAHGVLATVKDQVIQRHGKKGLSKDAFKAEKALDVVETAVWDIDVQKLAKDKQSTSDAVRRALNVVLDQSSKLLANRMASSARTSARRSSNTQLLLGDTVPASCLGDLKWPVSIPEHASTLKSAHTTVFEKRGMFGEHHAIIPLKDLETLLFGSNLLDLRIGHVYANLLSNVSPQARQSFELAALPSNTALQQQEMLKGGRASGLGPPRPPPILTRGMPSILKNPHIKIFDHSAQPILSPKAPTLPTLESNKAGNLPLSFGFPRPPGAEVAMMPMPQEASIVKHELTRSPGQSPIKKKTRSDYLTPGPRLASPIPKKPKMPLNEYMIWASVERSRLKKFDPGLNSSKRVKQLAKIWENMTTDERAPFIALKQSDQERYKEQEKDLAAGGDIDSSQEREHWKDFWTKAGSIPRSEAAKNAELYLPLPDDDNKWNISKVARNENQVKAKKKGEVKAETVNKPSKSQHPKLEEQKGFTFTHGPIEVRARKSINRPAFPLAPGPQVLDIASVPENYAPQSSRLFSPPKFVHQLRRMPAMQFRPYVSPYPPVAPPPEKSDDLLMQIKDSNAKLSATLATPSRYVIGDTGAKAETKAMDSATPKAKVVIDLTSNDDEAVAGAEPGVEKVAATEDTGNTKDDIDSTPNKDEAVARVEPGIEQVVDTENTGNTKDPRNDAPEPGKNLPKVEDKDADKDSTGETKAETSVKVEKEDDERKSVNWEGETLVAEEEEEVGNSESDDGAEGMDVGICSGRRGQGR
ncbi:hypothetical protein K458DRAFT_148739 [Lentithecium fluviatile CBS 122367]|uniref:HMG box domain-containing protein n=1 Tax=Lentithecium fluviatile CBS 122367 TaxID=1168545 RepID=A0A6G1JD87_9PLEO|nr:hypothetical protein K458DRAFT_148739 [Lentithecium fluviatile CBS 122367]